MGWPDAPSDAVENFVGVMKLSQFCLPSSEMDKVDFVKDLEESMLNSLARQDDSLCEMMEEFEAAEDEVSSLKKHLTAAKKGGDAAEIKSATKDLADQEKEVAKQKLALAKLKVKEFRKEQAIFQKVKMNVPAVFDRILLQHGVQDVQQHLEHMFRLFKGSVQDFSKAVGNVSEQYSKSNLMLTR